MLEGIFVIRKMSPLASIDNRNQTGGSYLSRSVRRGRKRRSKVSASCWNVSETADFDRSVCTDVAFGALRLLKTVAETIKVSYERGESSAPRVRHGFLKSSPLTLTSFMETFAIAAQ